jgi:hypothetical protein
MKFEVSEHHLGRGSGDYTRLNLKLIIWVHLREVSSHPSRFVLITDSINIFHLTQTWIIKFVGEETNFLCFTFLSLCFSTIQSVAWELHANEIALLNSVRHLSQRYTRYRPTRILQTVSLEYVDNNFPQEPFSDLDQPLPPHKTDQHLIHTCNFIINNLQS